MQEGKLQRIMHFHLGLSDRLSSCIQRQYVLFKGGSDFAKTLQDKKLTVISLMGMIVCPKQCVQVAREHRFSLQSFLLRLSLPIVLFEI